MGYKKDLQANLFHSGKKITVAVLKQQSSYVQRALNAHTWAIRVVETGHTKLLLTPTVQVELSGMYKVSCK